MATSKLTPSAPLAFASTCWVIAAACELPPTPADRPVPVTFEIPRGGFPAFLDTPWPNDLLRREENGAPRLDLRSFPNPFQSSALDDYLLTIQDAPGFASAGTIYFQVEGGVDPTSLPRTASDSVSPSASMFLIEEADVDRRIPIVWNYYPDGTAFLPAGTLAVSPLLGAAVHRTASLVVTSAVRAAHGAPLGPSPDLLALMTCAPIEDLADPPDCAPYQSLVSALGRTPPELALLSRFTPSNATVDLEKAFSWLREQPAAVPRDLIRTSQGEYTRYDTYEGVVDLLQFQVGAPPFDASDGITGGFELDDEGVPIAQRTEPVRFLLTVPHGEAPAGGWPIAINGHGTGGDLYSGLGNSASAEAHQLAAAGFAMLAISEPLHNTRQGFRDGAEDIYTFNFLNPLAGRDNWRQSALEKVQLVTLAQALSVPGELNDGVAVLFDGEQIAYFGHSQGGITGAIFLGVEDRIHGAFLSGAGAGFAVSLVEKVEPVEIASVLRAFLSMPEDEPVDSFHPVLALLQTWVDPADPLNYGPLWRHRSDRPTPHLVATSGLTDPYSPKSTHAGLAGAFELPIVGEVFEPWEIVTLKELESVPAGSAANLVSDSGAPLSAGILQYPNDGHFAVFRNPNAQQAFFQFFESLTEGPPTMGGAP